MKILWFFNDFYDSAVSRHRSSKRALYGSKTAQNGPGTVPRWPKMAPIRPQESLRGAQVGFRGAQDAAKMAQVGSQRGPKRAPRGNSDPNWLGDPSKTVQVIPKTPPDRPRKAKIIENHMVFNDFDDSAVSRHKSNLGQKKAPMGPNLSPSLGHPLAVLFQFAPLGLPKRSRTASKTAHEGQNCASCWLTAPKMAAYCPRWFPRSLQDGPPRLQDGPWDPQDASGRAPEGQNH